MSPLKQVHPHEITREVRRRAVLQNWLLAAIVLLLLLLFLHGHGWAQAIKPTGQGVQQVNCVSGCSASSGPSFGAAFPATGIAIGVKNGANMVNLAADGSSNLFVNCASGCAGGSSTPADTFANPTTAGLSMAFPMLWNGATWDRQYGDKTNGAFVNIKNAIALAVTGTFWQATQPVSNAGTFAVQAPITSWGGGTLGAMANYGTSPGAVLVPGVNAFITNTPAVTGSGNFTVVQATGTNLHAVLDTTSTTAVTQATGTNLHAVLDTTSTTAVTQATASNLNAQVVGAGADGSATSGNPVLVAGKGSGNARVPIVCDNWKPFSLASTTSLKLVTLASAKQVYICSINIVSAGANNVALIEGTKVTTDCDTATAGLAGGTTAATGWNFAANGGLTQGSGIGAIMATATVAHDVCLLASASTQVSGTISWTQF